MSIAVLWIVALVVMVICFTDSKSIRKALIIGLVLLLIVASYPAFKRGLKEIKSDLPQIGVTQRLYIENFLPTEFHEAMDTLNNITKP